MIQQYVLLRKENDLLKSLIGQSYNQKNKRFEQIILFSPFANTGPEDSLQNSNVGGYVSGLGQIQVTATIGPTVGAGTVSETVDMWHFQDVTTSVPRNFLMAHDLISPGVAFIAAQTLTVQYTWQI